MLTIQALKKLFVSPQDSKSDTIDFSAIPVMTGEELIEQLGQVNRVRSISKKVMIDKSRFEMMYISPIHRFCELAQMLPASQAHHHSFAGGLIIHTLSVAEIAIHERQKYNLPLGSDPELIEEERNLWTYAIFIAALSHDVGKIFTMANYKTAKEHRNINIFEGSLLDQKISEYIIEFKPTDSFAYHQKIGTMFLPILLNPICLSYLSSKTHIFRELLAYIHDDSYEWGSIGNILKTADQISTKGALKLGNNTRRFPGANLENFGERLMRTLRLILNNSSIKKNRAGAVFWTTSEYTYAVAKPFAELIREEMEGHGASDVPRDNTRIFDELQHQDFCETAQDGGAVFNVRIETVAGIENKEYQFTCIKIKNNKLYQAKKLPQPLAGSISEITHSNSTSKMTTRAEIPHEKEEKPIVADHSDKNIPEQIIDDYTDSESPIVEVESVAKTETNDVHTAAEEPQKKHNAAPVQIAKSNAGPGAELKTDHSRVVREFFDWIDNKTHSKEYEINKNSPLFIMEHDGIKHFGIMTPITFLHFAEENDLLESGYTAAEGKQKTSELQASLHANKINVGIAGQQIHYFKKTNSASAKPTRLSFYLVPVGNIPNVRLRELVKAMDFYPHIERSIKKK